MVNELPLNRVCVYVYVHIFFLCVYERENIKWGSPYGYYNIGITLQTLKIYSHFNIVLHLIQITVFNRER